MFQLGQEDEVSFGSAECEEKTELLIGNIQ